jgi:medium-chain acyl-[acyl-carrier-protein] hydrolase
VTRHGGPPPPTGPATAANTWVARLRPQRGVRRRLFCFPHAGGGAATFRLWIDDLPADIDLCSIRLPGRESRLREPSIRRLTDLGPALAHAIAGQLDLPFALFGHCSGALVAFELARELRRAGHPAPVRLFASAFPAPRHGTDGGAVHALPFEAFVEHLRQLGLLPAALLNSPNLLRMFEDGLRADFELFETASYAKEAPLDVPISVFGARRDQSVTLEELVDWGQETRQEFALRLFPGDHTFFESARQTITRAVASDLGLTEARD